MQSWTRWVLRHKLIVLVMWVVFAGLGAGLAGKTSNSLSFAFALPGEPGYEANQDIARQFGPAAADPLVIAVSLPNKRVDSTVEGEFATVVDRAAATLPGSRVASYGNSTDSAFVSGNGKSTFALIYPQPIQGQQPYASAIGALRSALADVRVAGEPVVITGVEALKAPPGQAERSVLVEAILGGIGALFVLALVFSSLLAFAPLVIAAVSILSSFLCLFLLTRLIDVSFVVQYLVALIGLGVAIDYGLLIVMRWREERASGRDNDAAVITAMVTAGHSVVFSGVTVAVSLAALVAIPLPFLRSIGFGGLLIPLLSVAVSITLLPVLLSVLGPRLEWPRRAPRDPGSAMWQRIASGVVRRPALTAIFVTLLLLALTAPVLDIKLGSPELNSYRGVNDVSRLVSAGVPAGAMRPVELITGDPTAVRESLATMPGVARVIGPTGPGWSADGTSLLQAWTKDDPATAAGKDDVKQIRRLADEVPKTKVGGTAAQDADFVEAVYGNALLALAVIVVLTVVLLMRALQSVVLPLKALLLNVLSIGAAYGITVLVWQDGFMTQALFGQEPSGAITTWVPISVFAFLFGLSMDYELFILARIREEYVATGSTPAGIIRGISYTGRLVTSGALVLLLAFVALSTVPVVEVKILATGLAAGIVIDALLVRGLLAPALLRLMGGANWWMPHPLRRVLRIADVSNVASVHQKA